MFKDALELAKLKHKNFKDNGIFESHTKPFDVDIKSLNRGMLKPLTQDDSSRIFNQFAEILRHNVVSDKPNAFNKIFNLFLCKIVDEDRTNNEELMFQWRDDDTDESLQKRLSDLYKRGMKQYLSKDITDYSEKQLEKKLLNLDDQLREEVQDMFTKVRLYKNNEFAFKEVFDEKSFKENAIVVREMVELLQPYQIRYTHKQQFLGDFFELLLNTGVKQESGQFFTPVPIARFIIASLPIKEIIRKKIENGEQGFLPYLIDYASGSGHFLTEAMDEIQKIIESWDTSNEKPIVKNKIKGWKENPFDWAYEHIYGIELDYRLVKTSKVSCFLNGDGFANIIHANGLDNFQKSNDFKGKLKQISHNDSRDNGEFDILVANPPYSVSAFKNTVQTGNESFELYDKLTDNSSEIECLFIERAKQLLKPGGVAGIILPSSILSNSGIYTSAREFILKYFKIKAIAEFGSNTFMATGTNTVVLFLERRSNDEWKLIQQQIDIFCKKGKDTNINGINNAISCYLKDNIRNLPLSDYHSIFGDTPTDTALEHPYFQSYREPYQKLKQANGISFSNFADNNEKKKLLAYILSKNQEVVVIKTGEKQVEKDFLGYEFSARRGNEGIQIYKETNGEIATKLYDSNFLLNSEKTNFYIYNSFLNNTIREITSNLTGHIFVYDLCKLLNFNTPQFNTVIELIPSNDEQIEIQSKWTLKPLGKICDVKIGGTPSRKIKDYYRNGNNVWVSIAEMNGSEIFDSKERITDEAITRSNVKLVKKGTTLISFKLSIGKTAIAGVDLYTNEAIAGLELANEFVKCHELDNERKVADFNKYLFILFDSKYIELKKRNKNTFGKSLNSTYLNENIQIPIPPESVRKDIILNYEKVQNTSIGHNNLKSELAKIKDLKLNIVRTYLV